VHPGLSYKSLHLEIQVIGKNVSTLNLKKRPILLQGEILLYYCFITSILLELKFLCIHAAARFIRQQNLKRGKVVPIHFCLFSISHRISPNELRWEEVKQLEQAVFKAAVSRR